MYPIHDYHLYFSSAGARADVDSLAIAISHPPDASIAKLLIEKGESQYCTDSNKMFVLTGFMLKCCQVVGCMHTCVRAYVRVCVRVCVHVCVHACVHAYMHACVRVRTCVHVCIVHMCELQSFD